MIVEVVSMLSHPVTVLSGIGQAKAKLAAKLEIRTVRDVLFSYPRSYKNFSQILSVDQAEIGKEALFWGELTDLQEKKLPKNRRLVQARLLGKQKLLNLSWFTVSYGRSRSYQFRRLQNADKLWVYGTVKAGFYGAEISGGEFFIRKPQFSGLVPVYPLVSGITNQMRLKWIEFALNHLDELDECLPSSLLRQYMKRRQAIRVIHFPANKHELQRARRRIIFEEFFLFHIGLASIREIQNYVVHKHDGNNVTVFLNNLPFKLTKGQQKAIVDVRKDMEARWQMRRLIQGDVGCGKTVVAEYASLKAVDSGGQVAIMVPTEILARQMFMRINEHFQSLDVECALLIGKTRTREYEQILTGLADGSISVVVGTHALISDNVKFANLTLAIVDEQHRFGVRQRLALSDKGIADLIVMSATPIPRSLALTLYGDLDTTIIEDMPKGRKKIDTRLIHPNHRDEVYRFLVERVKAGEQGFVVFPLVEESDKLDLKAAIQEMESLSKKQLAGVKVGLVHGQMGREKDQIMQEFYDHKLDVLVSTTVIEVGMNIIEATVMIIEDANRFGLAQLHQLRGRVGRSSKQAYCFLVDDPQSDIARKRLNVIRNTNNGLKIAEEDLKIRGPGDLLGTRQSGEPWFKLADLIRDQKLLEQAAKAAREILVDDPKLMNYPHLATEIKRQQS